VLGYVCDADCAGDDAVDDVDCGRDVAGNCAVVVTTESVG